MERHRIAEVLHLCCAALLLLPLAACNALQPAAPAGNLDAFTRLLDQRVPRWLAEYDVPGAQVALVHAGQLAWSRGFGVAEEAAHRPVTPDTVFKSASLSKAVTAWGVMHLVEQGRIDLDAPVERYLSRWHIPPSRYDPSGVTVRRLLSHTAGISSHVPPTFPAGAQLPSPEQALLGSAGRTAPVTLAMRPGSFYNYTGGGYTILQLLIEEVTGQRFADYMRQSVLMPLGMQHSSFDWRLDLRPATAVGYSQAGQPYPNDVVAEQAAAGLYTTASDLARFVAAGMADPGGQPPGRAVLSPQSVELMYTPVIEMPPGEALSNSTIGLGHFIEVLPDGTRLVSHAGTNWGWQLIFMSLPERGDGIVILTNGTRGIGFYAHVLEAWSSWLGIPPPRLAATYRDLRAVVAFLGAILALAVVLAIRLSARAVRTRRRQWLWRFPTRPPLRAYLAFGLSMLFAALLAAAWCLVAHRLLDWLIGRRAFWLTAPVLLWSACVAVNSLLRPAPAGEIALGETAS